MVGLGCVGGGSPDHPRRLDPLRGRDDPGCRVLATRGNRARRIRCCRDRRRVRHDRGRGSIHCEDPRGFRGRSLRRQLDGARHQRPATRSDPRRRAGLSEPAGGFELRHEIDVERDPGAVFDFLTSPEGLRAVDPALVDYGPPGPIAAGGTGWFAHRRGAMVARTTWRVTGFEPPTHLEVEIAGMGYGMTEGADLEATATGTRARFVDRVWPTSIAGRVLVALSGGIMRRDLRA